MDVTKYATSDGPEESSFGSSNLSLDEYINNDEIQSRTILYEIWNRKNDTLIIDNHEVRFHGSWEKMDEKKKDEK